MTELKNELKKHERELHKQLDDLCEMNFVDFKESVATHLENIYSGIFTLTETQIEEHNDSAVGIKNITEGLDQLLEGLEIRDKRICGMASMLIAMVSKIKGNEVSTEERGTLLQLIGFDGDQEDQPTFAPNP